MVVTAVMALAMSASAVAADFINNIGGSYKVITHYTELEDNDILLFASYAKADDETTSKVRIMTTLDAEHTGKCGYYTYPDYDYDSKVMPLLISVGQVNYDGYPYEYTVSDYKIKSVSVDLHLQNIDSKYIDTQNGSFVLESTINKKRCWNFAQNTSYPEIVNVVTSSSSKCMRCINEGEEAGYFVCCKVTDNNPVYTYRKVYNVSIGSMGYSTFYSGNNDVKLPSGVKAFTYKLEGNMLVPSYTYDGDNGDVLPHATAVILRATAGEYTLVVKNCQTECKVESVLSGTDENAVTTSKYDDASCKYYVLTKGSKGLGFYYVNDEGAPFTNKAHKAYLCLPTAVATNGVRFMLPTDTPTAVNGIGIYNIPLFEATDGNCYDLSGKRTSATSSGIKIKRGKKYVK